MIDLFEEVRGLELHERLATGERGRFTPAELLTAATATGTPPWAGDGGGRIAAGAAADLVVVDTDTRSAPPASTPDQILYAATARRRPTT